MQGDMFQADDDAAGVVLIDGYGFVHRAFHVMPALATPDGRPCNATLGFCRMLAAQMRTHARSTVAVVFERDGGRHRREILPSYKANRPALPDGLEPQLRQVRDATRAFGLEGIEVDGWEADDVIATYAREAAETRSSLTVVTSDKDLLQVMQDGVVEVYDPVKRKVVTRGDVMDRFGVGPDRLPDVQALLGDDVDNVPGVPGIGKKKAAALIGRYGSLEAVLGRLEAIEPKGMREALARHADDARVSLALTRLRTDVPVPLRMAEIRHRPNERRLLRWLDSMGFQALARELNLRHLTR